MFDEEEQQVGRSPQKKHIFLQEDLAIMKLKTLNICAIMVKNHSGQAPCHLVFLWEMSQSWPCHTITLNFESKSKSPIYKIFGQTNLIKCLKNALLKISINFRMDYVGVLSSSLGTHAIELNIDFRAQIGPKTETDSVTNKI